MNTFIKFHHFFLILLLTVASSMPLAAQDELSNAFEFQEGFYNNIQEFQSNTPTLPLSNFNNLDYELDAEKNMLILSAAAQGELADKLTLPPWGLSIAGHTFVRIPKEKGKEQEDEFQFVKLHVIGKLCYYQYKTFRTKMVMMHVHNPYTGEKVGQRQIANKELVTIKKMMDAQTGQQMDFTPENFKQWTQDDKGLYNTLKDLSETELKEKLFKTLLIYNDRNPFYIKS